MRRFLRVIVLMAVFLGGYYVGRLPNSPDVFGWSVDVYHRADRAAREISAKAKAEDMSVPAAALSYALAPGVDTHTAQE